MVQRIWNSPILSTRLKKRIKAAESAVGAAANLHAAKHRFESFAAPLGRMLLHLEEFLDEVQETCDERGNSKEAEDCWNWLDGLDDEKLYQLAMLADCADEILMTTRVMDSEDVDTSTMHSAARELLDRLDALFNKKQCVDIPGYTRHVLEILKRPRIIYGPHGVVKSIGGRDAQGALQNCFHRMSAYTALVADVVRTEFPDYELFGAFSVFNLEESNGRLGANNDTAMRRLAQALNVNHAALCDQYHRFRPVAMQKKTDGISMSNKQAWQAAVQACSRAARSNPTWSMDALLPVLWRFVGWTAATSGVEQNFSKAMRSIGPQRANLTDAHEETAVRLAVYKPSNDELEDVVARARVIWDAHYGCCRQQTSQRCDKGTSREQIPADNTEKAWLDKRRDAASDVGRKLGDASALSIEAAAGGSGWTEGHDKEHTFQAKKRAKKELQAFDEGLLLEHEIRPDMQDALNDRRLKDQKADRDNKRKVRKHFSLRQHVSLSIRAGTTVCVMTSAGNDDLSQILRLHGATLEEEMSLTTQMLVVDSPTDLTKIQKWVSALSGVLVCSAEALRSLGQGRSVGSFLKYKDSIAESKHRLHITQEFSNKHGAITRLLREACQLPKCRWKISDVVGPRCVVLGGPAGRTASEFLKSITCIIRTKSRAR